MTFTRSQQVVIVFDNAPPVLTTVEREWRDGVFADGHRFDAETGTFVPSFHSDLRRAFSSEPHPSRIIPVSSRHERNGPKFQLGDAVHLVTEWDQADHPGFVVGVWRDRVHAHVDGRVSVFGADNGNGGEGRLLTPEEAEERSAKLELQAEEEERARETADAEAAAALAITPMDEPWYEGIHHCPTCTCFG